MKKFILLMISAVFTLTALAQKDKSAVLLVSDYVVTDGSVDVADAIQRIIDENPHRTIYFPDGTYLLSHPLVTPADPELSVHLELSNYAILKAAEGWKEGEALVRLGGSHPKNSITIIGSNYGLTGGIMDGSNVADGISIDGGRETRVKEVSIKNTRI
jgi:polygalacturonase